MKFGSHAQICMKHRVRVGWVLLRGQGRASGPTSAPQQMGWVGYLLQKWSGMKVWHTAVDRSMTQIAPHHGRYGSCSNCKENFADRLIYLIFDVTDNRGCPQNITTVAATSCWKKEDRTRVLAETLQNFPEQVPNSQIH